MGGAAFLCPEEKAVYQPEGPAWVAVPPQASLVFILGTSGSPCSWWDSRPFPWFWPSD
jgi:hypothetical protein